jgi:LacI family transcriptional regulator
MTIKDIARESGYSIGTVSRVLNDMPGVSQAAKEAVMEVVDKHHFQLNNNAKYLKQQSSAGIAVIIKGTQNMLFSALVEPMQALIEKNGYVCAMYYIGEDENEVEHALTICMERRPMGILFLGSNQENFIKDFSRIGVPCVLVTNSAADLKLKGLSSVSTDDREAARMAVEHLVAMGHREIGVLGGHLSLSYAAKCRYEGVKDAMTRYKLDFSYDRQYEASYFSISAGYSAMERLLDKMPQVTAVFAMSDVTAIGAMRAISDRGLKVPEDISVMGYDGIDIGRYMIPRLTTIRQHREVMASRSVEILLDCIEGRSSTVYEVESFHLVPGESVRPR